MQRWEVVAGDGDWSRGAAENLPQEGKELAGGLRVPDARSVDPSDFTYKSTNSEIKFQEFGKIFKDK